MLFFTFVTCIDVKLVVDGKRPSLASVYRSVGVPGVCAGWQASYVWHVVGAAEKTILQYHVLEVSVWHYRG